MAKRMLSAVLWFYTGWYAGAILAHLLGVAPIFGPVVGAIAATLMAGDVRKISLRRREPARLAG
jgi:hypothetical protein